MTLSPQNTVPNQVVPWSRDDKADLSEAIGRVCALQRTYGKNPADLETLVEGFAWVMKRYPVSLVIEGLAQYLENGVNIPTPSEIIAIIDPKPKTWVPDKSYYISLKKNFEDRGIYGLDNDEIEYIRRYEEYQKNELRSSNRVD